MAHCSSRSTPKFDTAPVQHNLDKQTTTQLDVDLKGTLLTPLACSSLVSELIKNLIFQKSQIPYPYNWLKAVVDRKRKKDAEEQGGIVKNLQVAVERCFRLASSAYDNLEDIMYHIRKEMESSEVQEVILLFGSTPFSPKQIYCIKLPVIVRGHLEVNHHQANNRNQQNILRQILLSDTWIQATGKSMPSTNMYVMLKKVPNAVEDDFFHIHRNFSVSSRVENVVINLFYESEEESNCCSDLQIFGDNSNSDTKNTNKNGVSDNCEWYQAKIQVAGFKDYYVGKVSASDLW